MVMRSLQLEAEANGQNGDFFKERCVNITNDMYSCRPESCDGVYRTFSGCCNNLIHKQYGQIVKVDDENIVLSCHRKGQCSPKEVPPSSLPVRNSAQGGTGQLLSS